MGKFELPSIEVMRRSDRDFCCRTNSAVRSHDMSQENFMNDQNCCVVLSRHVERVERGIDVSGTNSLF